MQIYMVGGAVRDMVRNIEPQDRDFVVVGGTCEEMLAKGFECVGKDFPVFLHPKTKEEYALARKEIKTGDKHTDFKFVFDASVTLEEDVVRRDFTCNALVYDLESAEIIDLVGGKKDIENKIIRHINTEHFVEDPLRVLRMCRFTAQLNFEIAPETMALATQMVGQGMLQHLTKERVWQEFYKALCTHHFSKFILSMRQCGALQELLPEVNRLWQVPEVLEYHPEGNSGAHTIMVLEKGEHLLPVVKYALLMHDIGKSRTPADVLPHHYMHDSRGANLIDKIGKRLCVPKFFTQTAHMVALNHMRFFSVPEMRLGTLRDFVAEITHNFRQIEPLQYLMQVCLCDMLGRQKPPSAEELAKYLHACEKCVNTYHCLAPLKATDMPRFDELPKDETFAVHWREFQIDKLYHSHFFKEKNCEMNV